MYATKCIELLTGLPDMDIMMPRKRSQQLVTPSIAKASQTCNS